MVIEVDGEGRMRVGEMSPSVLSEVAISVKLPDWEALCPTYIREGRYKTSAPATLKTLVKHISHLQELHLESRMSSPIKKVAIVGVRHHTFHNYLYLN